jgi:hypothetical protein
MSTKDVTRARIAAGSQPDDPDAGTVDARMTPRIGVVRSRREGYPERGIIAVDRGSSRRLTRPVPPINELTRIEPVVLARLDRMGIFTTGLLLEVSETPTRRQTLADQVGTDTTEVLTWRDEALMLNLASFGPDEHQLMIQAGIEGLRKILDLDLDAFRERTSRAATGLGVDPPSELTLEGWWDQARTLEDE